jgi:hypothetical protein
MIVCTVLLFPYLLPLAFSSRFFVPCKSQTVREAHNWQCLLFPPFPAGVPMVVETSVPVPVLGALPGEYFR